MRTGLYTPGDYKDNCGFGLLAHLKGQPSHELLKTAIQSLTCMTHRGGIAAVWFLAVGGPVEDDRVLHELVSGGRADAGG